MFPCVVCASWGHFQHSADPSEVVVPLRCKTVVRGQFCDRTELACSNLDEGVPVSFNDSFELRKNSPVGVQPVCATM